MKKTKNIVIKKGCHSRGMLSGISLIRNRKQAENFCLKTTKQKGDPRQKPSGMTPLWNGGFTLIELLVVVLIIGILAAVAVPQYQKAVRKARIAEAQIILKALVDASDVYILQHGNYDNISMESLDIEVPTQTKNWTFEYDECVPNSQGRMGCSFYAIPRFETGYSIYYSSSNYDDEWANKWLCWPDDEAGQKICQPLGKDMELEDYEFGMYEMTL